MESLYFKKTEAAHTMLRCVGEPFFGPFRLLVQLWLRMLGRIVRVRERLSSVI